MIRALDHFLLRVFFGACLANLIAEDHPLITAALRGVAPSRRDRAGVRCVRP